MEYEIYYLCNLLGVALVFVIVLFHYVDADKKLKISADQQTDGRKNLIK
jgi:hypothetical protein